MRKKFVEKHTINPSEIASVEEFEKLYLHNSKCIKKEISVFKNLQKKLKSNMFGDKELSNIAKDIEILKNLEKQNKEKLNLIIAKELQEDINLLNQSHQELNRTIEDVKDWLSNNQSSLEEEKVDNQEQSFT